ncbi:peptide MFS transporter [Burkholderiaceae bacterium UC74_6]
MIPSPTLASAPTSTPAGAATFFGQPRGLVVLFLTEMWEKFSFFGMRALQVYYMIKQLHFSQADASMVYGLYAGGVYLTPIVGGYVADRWLGRKRAILIGGGLMALGHFTLTSEALFFPALVLIALGNGLFLPSLPSQVGDLYALDDPRRGGAYNIYYMGVNLGALLGVLGCGVLGETYGWHAGFGAAGVGMCIGLLVYALNGRHLPPDRPGVAAVVTEATNADAPKRSLLPLLFVALAVVVFRSAYEQSGNTYAVWADARVDRHLFGWLVPASWLQALNPLFVFAFTPFLVAAWRRAALRGREPTSISKMALGAAGVALSFALLAALATGTQPVAMLWMIVFFALYTLGELYILPVGLGLFARLAPAGMGATVIAAWFLASFGGNLLSGVVGRAYEAMGPSSFFGLLAAIAGAAAVALLALGPMVRRIDR